MGQLAVDTTFLIDFQREAGSPPGKTAGFLVEHATDQFFVSLTVLGEYAVGFFDLNDPFYRQVRQAFGLLAQDEEVALAYRESFRWLKSHGCLIGANDLWIAATAIRYDMPLVTRNADEFARIPDLEVVSY
jgi:tRNA(fMet)-specific endonuclease VapC